VHEFHTVCRKSDVVFGRVFGLFCARELAILNSSATFCITHVILVFGD